MNTATIAISAKELNSFLRVVRNEACRAIATPAAIRNQPAYGRVATPTRQPATMIGNELEVAALPEAGASEGDQALGEEHRRLLVQEAREEDPARLEGEHPGGDHRRPRARQLVDGGGEQDEPRDRDPDLGDAKDEVGRVERPELDREHELVQIVDDRGGPVRRRERRVRDVGGVAHEGELVAAAQLGGDRSQRDAGRGQQPETDGDPDREPDRQPRTAASEQPHQRVEAEPDDGERQRSREDVVDLLIGCGG